MNHNTYPNSPQGNYELQQARLAMVQQEISDRLFESGAVSRILASDAHAFGVPINTDGVNQLGKVFVPTLARRTVDNRKEKMLRLTTIETDQTGSSFAYRNIGEIDEQGFMHVLPGIPEDDAWSVYNESVMLQRLKTGTETELPELPNLDSTLLTVYNPNTGITRVS